MSEITLPSISEFSPLSQNIVSTRRYEELSASPEVRHDNDTDDVWMSPDVYWRAMPVMYSLLYALQAIGLVLNAINIIVMTRPTMRNPTTTFLVALSVLQLVYTILGLIPSVYRTCRPLDYNTDKFYAAYRIYVTIYGGLCLRRSMYCIQCCVSVERLLAVWLPLKAKQFLLVRRPWLFIFITPVVVFVTHVHFSLRLEVVETANQKNATSQSFRYTEQYRRHPEIFDNLGIVLKTIFVYLTLVMLITINLAMIGVIKRYASVRRQMKTNVDVDAAQKRETQMTVTILVSTLFFVVLCLPTTTYALLIDVAPQTFGLLSINRYLFLFMQTMGGLLFALAFTTDFFTYMSLSSAYRNTFLRMLKIRRQKDALLSAKSRSN